MRDAFYAAREYGIIVKIVPDCIEQYLSPLALAI